MSAWRNKLLSDATPQEIQLELIRRRRFNQFDGRVIVASLERHRELWLAVYMHRVGLADSNHPDWIHSMSLIPLRDLPADQWNVDTLFILSEDTEHSRLLAGIAANEKWLADEVIVQDNEDELSGALGQYPCQYGVLTAWWD